MQNREVLTGFVLHKRAYRETSLIVDFFTHEFGRVSAVAKGARGASKSERKSLLQSFQLLEFELSGRSQLKNLGRIEGKQSALNLQGKALYCGFYVNEILTRALPESEPSPALFAQYQKTLFKLKSLMQTECKKINLIALIEFVLREFEFSLLSELGYLPDFEYEAQTGALISSGQSYSFTPNIGFEICHKDLKNAISGEHLIAIGNGHFNVEQNDSAEGVAMRKAAKTICRKAIVELIGNKPIKSRELFF